MEIFKLMGSVFIDTKEAENSIQKTDSKMKQFGDKLGSGIKTAAKWGAAIGGAAIAGGAALFGMAKKSADATDRIDKLSQKIGISKQGFQEWEYVLSQNGTDIEKLQVGLKTLTQRMGESADGTGKGAEAFKKLGLTATDLNGNLKDQEVMFDETARAMMQMPEGAEKSQMAFDLFGKAGLELMPLLNGTEEDMDALKQQAHDLGLVLDDETVAAGANFTDTLDNVQRSFGSVITIIGAKVMPIIQEFLDWVLAHMPEIQAIIGVVFEKIGQFVEVVVNIFRDHLIPAFQKVYEWTIENWPAIKETIGTVIDAIVDRATSFVEIFTMIWDTYGENIKTSISIAWDLIKTVFTTAFEIIKGIVDIFISVFKGDWEGLGEALRSLIDTAWNLIKDVFDLALKFIANLLDVAITTFKTIAGKIMTAIWTAFKEVWEKIKTWTSESWDKLAKLVEDFKTKFKEVAKTIFTFLWDGLKEIWATISTWVSTSWESLKTLVEDFKTKFKAAAKTVFTFLWDGLKEIWTTINSWVSTSFDNLKTAIVGFGSKFFEAGKAIFNKLLDGLKNIWTTVITWIDGIFPGLGTKISGFASNFVQAGKDIFNGVWDGMKSIWTGISTWIGEKTKQMADALMFWKKDKAKMDESPTSGGTGRAGKVGIANIPYNGFRVLAHEGERLLNREEAKEYNQGSRGGRAIKQTVNIYSPKAMSPSEVARENKKALQRLALQFPS